LHDTTTFSITADPGQRPGPRVSRTPRNGGKIDAVVSCPDDLLEVGFVENVLGPDLSGTQLPLANPAADRLVGGRANVTPCEGREA
jgi:hypothetical protein